MGVFGKDAPTVPRELHDMIVRQYEQQLERLHRTAERSITKEAHDSVVAALTNQLSSAMAMIDKLQDQARTTLTETLAIKRSQMDMAPKEFDASTMGAMAGLGPKTEAAIEEFCNGDPQIRKDLIHQAHVDALGIKARGGMPEDIDTEVADLIRRGDTV